VGKPNWDEVSSGLLHALTETWVERHSWTRKGRDGWIVRLSADLVTAIVRRPNEDHAKSTRLANSRVTYCSDITWTTDVRFATTTCSTNGSTWPWRLSTHLGQSSFNSVIVRNVRPNTHSIVTVATTAVVGAAFQLSAESATNESYNTECSEQVHVCTS